MKVTLIRDIEDKAYRMFFRLCQLISKYIPWMITASTQNFNKYRRTCFNILGYNSFHSKSKDLFTYLLSKLVSPKNMCTKEISVSNVSHASKQHEQKMQRPRRWLYLPQKRTTSWSRKQQQTNLSRRSLIRSSDSSG